MSGEKPFNRPGFGTAKLRIWAVGGCVGEIGVWVTGVKSLLTKCYNLWERFEGYLPLLNCHKNEMFLKVLGFSCVRGVSK